MASPTAAQVWSKCAETWSKWFKVGWRHTRSDLVPKTPKYGRDVHRFVGDGPNLAECAPNSDESGPNLVEARPGLVETGTDLGSTAHLVRSCPSPRVVCQGCEQASVEPGEILAQGSSAAAMHLPRIFCETSSKESGPLADASRVRPVPPHQLWLPRRREWVSEERAVTQS